MPTFTVASPLHHSILFILCYNRIEIRALWHTVGSFWRPRKSIFPQHPFSPSPDEIAVIEESLGRAANARNYRHACHLWQGRGPPDLCVVAV